MTVISYTKFAGCWEFVLLGLKFTKTPYGFKLFKLKLFGAIRFQDGWALTLFGIRLEKDLGWIELSVGLVDYTFLKLRLSWRHYD